MIDEPKRSYLLIGGPYNGRWMYLSSPGTLHFSVGEWKGYYNNDNRWVSTK